ncbi:hypothetical protein GCM10009790_37590 [Georgenia ruanii]
MVVLLLAVAAVCGLAVAVSARAAATGLAVVLGACAVLRALGPVTAVPAARSRRFDVVLLALAALALLYLAPWGDALPTATR